MICSLLISTYNWPAALILCLNSVTSQSVLPDEIVIADDGSGKETADAIAQFAANTKIPVKHIWQQDEGFQLARIRNKAIAAASGRYIIQIDGDLILHRHFIKDHLSFRKTGCFATGSRMLLPKAVTEVVFQQKQPGFTSRTQGKNYFNGRRIPLLHHFLAHRYKTKGRNKYYVKGCNMAFWRKDLLAINGYSESFTGWGLEDTEIAIRLINAGIQKRFLKLGAICYHLFHKEANREMEAHNKHLVTETIEKKIVWAPQGVDQYIQEKQK